MPTTTIQNIQLVLKYDDTDYSCQIASAELTPPGYAEGETVQVACPDGAVVQQGETQNGSLRTNQFTDTSDGGITWAMMNAYMSGATVAYSVQWFADQDATVSFVMSGNAKVAQFSLPFEKPGLSRHDLELTLHTGTLARPAAA
jgi:hypothetical protein